MFSVVIYMLHSYKHAAAVSLDYLVDLMSVRRHFWVLISSL